MFKSWERQAAESLTNAEHMQQVRRRIDLEHQERLRRREQERAEAEVRRERHQRQLPTPPSFSKYSARTYDRPWAEGAPATKKPSPTSGHPDGSRKWSPSNKNSVSRLPAIARRARTGKQELAATSKTWQKTPAILEQPNKELPPLCHKQRLMNDKHDACKLSPCEGFYTPRWTRSKRSRVALCQESQKQKPKAASNLNRQVLSPVSRGQDPMWGLDRSSVPLSLSSPGRASSDWLCMSPTHYDSPSPEDKSDPQQIPNPFQGCLESDSTSEDISIGEDSDGGLLGGADLSPSSVETSLSLPLEPTPSLYSSEGNSLADSFIGSLSSQFHSLNLISSESEGEDDTLPAWMDGGSEDEPVSVQCTILHPCSPRLSTPFNTDTPVDLSTQVRLESSPLGEMDGASYSGGYSPMPPMVQAGGESSLVSITERAPMVTLPVHTTEVHQDHHLSDLNVHPLRASWTRPWLRHDTASPESRQEPSPTQRGLNVGTGQPFLGPDRQGVQEEVGETSMGHGLEATASSRIRPERLLDHLTLTLMALQDVRREVSQFHLGNTQEGSGTRSQTTKPPTDPETLRRITESLLEEDEEEEQDLCRICQCGGGTPTNPLQMPCQCTGSLQYVHHDCLKRWIQTKIESGAELSAVKTCELCKASLSLDLEDFDVEECYRRHHQRQVEQARPELHLLLLLQQRLMDVVRVVESGGNSTFRVATTLYLLQQTAENERIEREDGPPRSEGQGRERAAGSDPGERDT